MDLPSVAPIRSYKSYQYTLDRMDRIAFEYDQVMEKYKGFLLYGQPLSSSKELVVLLDILLEDYKQYHEPLY